jgi:hypothetical protein
MSSLPFAATGAPRIGDLEHGLPEQCEHDGAGTPRIRAVRYDAPHDNAEAYAALSPRPA